MDLHKYRWDLMHSDLSYRGKMVGIVIAQHCTQDKYSCYPSFDRLIELTGFASKSTVQKGLVELEDLWVKVDRKYHNTYTLTEDYLSEDSTTVVPFFCEDSTQDGTPLSTHLPKDSTPLSTPNGTTVVLKEEKRKSREEEKKKRELHGLYQEKDYYQNFSKQYKIDELELELSTYG